MNTVFTFVGQGSDSHLTQARLDRGLNSRLTVAGGRVLKRAKSSLIEREYEMLTYAAEAGVSVPHAKQIDDNTLSLQFLHYGETLLDYIQHGKFTKSLWQQVQEVLAVMWSAGIVHGDLHVNNILISEGRVYIIDMASSFHAGTLAAVFGDGDYSADVEEGITGDKQALMRSIRAAREAS